MHRHEVKEHSEVSQLSHLNSLFTGWGSRLYDVLMVRLTRRLYQRVIADLAPLGLVEGKVLDAGTGPGTLAREIARRQPRLQVYGIDLSEDMIGLARAHAKREQLEEKVHFESGNVAHLPYPDHSLSTIEARWDAPLQNQSGYLATVYPTSSRTSSIFARVISCRS